jgi:hypothetical protein
MKAKVWTEAELDARAELSKRIGRKPTGRWDEDGWTPEQDALLGTDHDGVIAEKIGRSEPAVTSRRVQRKIPAFSGWPGGGPGWTAEELALLGTADDEVIAQKVGPTVGAVRPRQRAERVAVFRDPSERGPVPGTDRPVRPDQLPARNRPSVSRGRGHTGR